jgi:hypothetical protein
VALAATYACLKAGATTGTALFGCAPRLVPLLASGLDDFDASARAMALLSLSVCFQRLRGSFGEEAIRELYPKLLKRLVRAVSFPFLSFPCLALPCLALPCVALLYSVRCSFSSSS